MRPAVRAECASKPGAESGQDAAVRDKSPRGDYEQPLVPPQFSHL
jgi:hypothetical protein